MSKGEHVKINYHARLYLLNIYIYIRFVLGGGGGFTAVDEYRRFVIAFSATSFRTVR